MRREWLETGEGEMYDRPNDDIIQQLLIELKVDEKSMEFLELFLRLNETNRKMVVAGLEQLAKMYFRSDHIEHLAISCGKKRGNFNVVSFHWYKWHIKKIS